MTTSFSRPFLLRPKPPQTHRKPAHQPPMNLKNVLLLLALTQLTLSSAASLHPTTRQPASCDAKSDCGEREACVNSEGSCASDCAGICAPREICTCQQPCDDGSTCVETFGHHTTFSTCFADELLESVEDLFRPLDCSDAGGDSDGGEGGDDDPTCIGVHHLSDFAMDELEFSEHVLANVLCDSMDNCATGGHIVEFNGGPMMMRKYCTIVGCTKRVMKVNSPRYKRGLKIESRRQDLRFTAFAARFATIAEETVLSAAVRIGL